MGLRTLLYVSKSLIPQDEAQRQIDSIIETARPRNAALGVTGVLIFTEARFAQVLEGPPASIDEIMDGIRADPRHEQVTTACDEPLTQRRFPQWSMGYSGPSLYVDRHIKPLLKPVVEARDRREMAGRLLYLMEELTRAAA
jgi:hypothetical protein